MKETIFYVLFSLYSNQIAYSGPMTGPQCEKLIVGIQQVQKEQRKYMNMPYVQCISVGTVNQ